MTDHLDLGRNDVQLLADLFPDAAKRSSAGTLFLRFGNVVDDLDAWQVIRQRFAAGFSPIVGANRDRLRRLAYFLRCFPLGLIKEPLLPAIFRNGALFGFSAEDLVSQQPNMFFQVTDLLLERSDDLLEFGGVIRQAVNVQKHAHRIAEA